MSSEEKKRKMGKKKMGKRKMGKRRSQGQDTLVCRTPLAALEFDVELRSK